MGLNSYQVTFESCGDHYQIYGRDIQDVMGGRSGRDGRFFYFHLLANWKNDYLCMRNTDRLRFRMIKKSPGGGIGRRARFRCEWFCDRAGSSPVLGTSQNRKNAILYRRR